MKRMIRQVLVVAFVCLSVVAAFAQYQPNAGWPRAGANNYNSGAGIGGGSNGKYRWSITTNSSFSSFWPSPAIGADGTVYTGANSGETLMMALNPDGSEKWVYPVPGSPYYWSSVSLGADGTVYFGAGITFYALDSTGKVKWTYPWGAVGVTAIASDGSILFGGGNDGTADGYLYALSKSGALEWKFNVGGAISPPIIESDGTIIVSSTGSGKIYALAPDGTQKWVLTPQSGINSDMVAGPDGTLYVLSSDGLDAYKPDGTFKWELGNLTAPWTPRVGSDGTIYIGTYTGIVAVNPDGTVKWRGGPSEAGEIAIGAYGEIYCVTSGEFVVCLNPDGSEQWSYDTTDFTDGQLAIAPDGTVFITGKIGYFTYVWELVAIGTPWISSVTLTPNEVVGGTSSSGQITLATPAPTGGLTVNLSSSDPSTTVPASVTVPAGATTATFAITTIPVTPGVSVTISAQVRKSVCTATLTVDGPTPQAMTLNPTTLYGGQTSSGLLTLTGPAPTAGLVVAMSSNDPSAAPPTTVTVPGGASSVSFVVATFPVTAKTKPIITATANGSEMTADLTVEPPVPLSVTASPSPVAGGNPVLGTVTLTGAASTGGVVVSLNTTNSAAKPPISVTVPAGSATATFSITTVPVTEAVTATISASIGLASVNTKLTVTPPDVLAISCSPSTVPGGSSSTGTVTMTGPAPAGGTVVEVSSDSSYLNVPGLLSIPAGSTSTTFTIGTTSPSVTTNATITAYALGPKVTCVLTVRAPSPTSLSLAPSTVVGGLGSVGTVTLNGQAGKGGLVVALKSSSPSASTPASVTVPQGANLATFNIATSSVSSGVSVTITASTPDSSAAATLALTPPVPVSLSFSPSSVIGGATATGTVTIDVAAPSGGAVVNLASNTSGVSVPASVTVPAGSTTATFSATTSVVSSQTNATVTASVGSVSVTGTLTMNPASLVGITISPTAVPAGESALGTVTLNGITGPGGITVVLSGNSTSCSVPASILVPAGASSATFTIQTSSVAKPATATISATLGSITKSASLTINTATLLGISLNPTTIAGGTSSTGTAVLTSAAGTGGVTVKLASSTKSASVPASVSIAAGKSSAMFTVKTVSVAAQTQAVISGSVGSVTESATLTIAPPSLDTITLKPTAVVGPAASTGTVTLTGPAPAGGLTVSLSSNVSAATVPATVTVPAGAAHAGFTVKTSTVGTPTTAQISAAVNGTGINASLTVNPPAIVSVALKPTSVTGGATASGTVTIGAAAPAGGIVVTLSSTSSSATVPASVTILQGKTSGAFTIQAHTVSTKTTVTIGASLGPSSKTAVLTIKP